MNIICQNFYKNFLVKLTDAIFTDMGATLTVTLNGLRLLKIKDK